MCVVQSNQFNNGLRLNTPVSPSASEMSGIYAIVVGVGVGERGLGFLEDVLLVEFMYIVCEVM